MKDLVKFVIKVAENPPEGTSYLLALDETENKTHKNIIEVISEGVGSRETVSVETSDLYEIP